MTKSDDDRDGRNSLARGYVVASRVTSIGLQMAVPPTIGWWADGKLKTAPWLMILGTVLGFGVAMMELMALAKSSERDDGKH
jgi:F0F1-type ATP synthase assembly protein I